MASLHSTLTANSDTYITVGKAATDLGITLKFTARRGSLNCMGTVKVSSPFTDYVKTPPVVPVALAALGITATADINGSDIRLKLTVDDASANDVILDYNKDVITGSKTAQ